ncbi:MAG: aldose 1-epimerase family protein [Clostridiales bacterium]|nr:aldose 1-epimerase family protein [Clostridiales bacterium]
MDIKLKSSATTAEIRLKGAQMVSFKGNDGREVIWQADPAVWPNYAPVLFPVCGMPKDEKVIISGVTYPMAKHGFTRNPDFQVARVGDDFVDLVLTPTEESRPQYPFDFAFHVVYTLRENGFRTDFIVDNHSERVMPFCVGGHPGFIVPMEAGAAYTDYQLVFPEKESGRNLLVPGGRLVDGDEIIPFVDGKVLPLSHDLFDDRDALVFPDLNSRSVDLVHKDTGKGLRFRYPKMEVLAVWSMPKKNAPYVCLEPWHGMPGQVNESGKFEDKPFVTLLQPGQSHQCGYDVELI